VTTISVSSQCKLPHPNADFASISALVSLTAELGEGDNEAVCVKKLQAQADNLVEQHLDAKRGRMRDAAMASKAQSATAQKTAELAQKHGGSVCK
jgi:hypothetical protein